MAERVSNNNKLHLSIDPRIVTILLSLVILTMLLLWRPWQDSPNNSARTITVTGESSLKAEPDEYLFMPTYEFTDADKATALADLTAKQTEVVAGLKQLGVADSKIKTDSNGYSDSFLDQTTGLYHYTINLQVSVNDKAQTQKIQDYLASTTPTGSVSPQATFSQAMRKKLEAQGRDQATKDARSKADQSADNLGFKLGAVKSVDDGASSGEVMPLYATDSAQGSDRAAVSSLPVQSGEDELNYSVTVIYYVK